MPAPIDVYRQWLQIEAPQRPLNHYQLLRLKQFEDDSAKIRAHYKKLNEHVRKFAGGEYAQQSQDLLNELSRAMLCLTDIKRKGEYDASLGRKAPSDGKRPSFEQILLGRKLVDSEGLARARQFADAIGIELRDALIQQKVAKADVVIPAFAESVGLPYVDLREMDINPTIFAKVPVVTARQHSVVPVLVDGKQLLVASPHLLDPEVEDDLRLRSGLTVRSVLCTSASINEVIDKNYPREAAAAEMATAASATPSAAKSNSAGKARKATPPEDWWKAPLVGFNFSFMVVVFALVFGLGWPFFPGAFFLGLLVGVIGGAITWKMA